MKLLILSHNLSRPSYRQRIEAFLPFLRAEGVEPEVHQFPKQISRRWSLFRSARDYDAVLLHKKCLNFWDARVLRKNARTIIYDFDDAIMFSPKKPDSNRTSHFRLFRRTIRLADCVIAGNDYLAEHARRYNSHVHVLPTGLDTQAYLTTQAARQDDTIRLVWIGSKSTLKYLNELKPMLEQIGIEHKQVVLRIIADTFPELTQMRVEKCPWSLQTQVSDLRACDIGLAPLPDNRFTRGKCGFKILQYFAAGLPVIASPVGVNQELVDQSQAGMTATTPEQWKDALKKMIQDSPLRTQMGTDAQRYVKRYDVTVLAGRFHSLIKDQAGK